nr:uncharacterized protein LOC106689512 isoform X2 [Halyomorpha halys]
MLFWMNPSLEGPVNHIALSSDEKLIAFSSLKGVTCIIEIQDGDSRVINRSVEHVGSAVTSLLWSKETNKLYIADNIGRLSVINVSLFLNKNIFNIPAYVFMKLDSAVVQISCYEEYLLISTKTRCYICDTTKEQYKQIGNQLREGFYGATFMKNENGFKIYCARPGSRLWEVDDSGDVVSTHQFKKALAVQSTAVVKPEENELVLKTRPCWPDQSFNFCYLFGFLDVFLLTFRSDGIYIFDPSTADVVLWSDYFKDIVMVKSVHDIIYVWTSLGQLYSFVITPLSKCLVQLYFLGKYKLCVEVLEAFLDQALSDNVMTKVGCLIGLPEQYPDIYKNSKVYGYIEKLVKSMKDKQSSNNLDSGIFLIDNKHWKKWKIGINISKSRKKRISRSKSMSDVKKFSKGGSYMKKLQYYSLPDIHFSLNDSFSFKAQNCPDDSLANSCTYLSSSFMHQIPFLSLTSPDIIQSTVAELGHNVKRKLFSSTKSLQNKLQFFEEKIKFPKGFLDGDVLDIELKYCSKDTIRENIIFPKMDDSIVYNISCPENVKNFVFDPTEICLMAEKLDESFNEESVFILFNILVEKLNDFNQHLTTNENAKKSFPFKQMLPLKHIEIIRNLLNRSLECGKIIDYVVSFKALNGKYLELQDHPLILQEVHKTEDLNNDVIMSNIILFFSEILDPSLILQHLENLKISCTFFSCSIVLDIFQETAFGFFASKKDLPLNYSECPLPYLLNMLFLMLRLDQIESACHIANKGCLKLHYISRLVLKLSMHLEFTGINRQNCIDRCNKLFLNFLMKLRNNKLYSVMGICDAETLHHIESAFFSVNKNVVNKCVCSYPLVGCSKYSIKFPIVGELLLKQNLIFFDTVKSSSCFKNNLYILKEGVFKNLLNEKESLKPEFSSSKIPTNISKCNFDINNLAFKENEKQNIYSKIISLLQTMPDLISFIMNYCWQNIELCLPFIIQFGKIDVLNDFIHEGSYEFWDKAFDLNLKLSSGFCCICQRKSENNIKVDWNQLSIQTLKSLGAKETLSLMMRYADQISSKDIDMRFFRTCLLSDIIQMENGNCSSLIDVYCSQPKFNAFRISAMGADMVSSSDILRSTSKTAPHSVTVDFKTELCCYCSLPLISDKVPLPGKIRIFKCDHIYHMCCLNHVKSNFECPLCKTNP